MVVAAVDDTARLADGTKAMEMTLTSFVASVCPVACPHWRGQTGSRRADRWGLLLLRGHGAVVDEADKFGEVDEECARANAGSGSHNLDAPYLARQRCRGKLSTTNTYGTGAPCTLR